MSLSLLPLAASSLSLSLSLSGHLTQAGFSNGVACVRERESDCVCAIRVNSNETLTFNKTWLEQQQQQQLQQMQTRLAAWLAVIRLLRLVDRSLIFIKNTKMKTKNHSKNHTLTNIFGEQGYKGFLKKRRFYELNDIWVDGYSGPTLALTGLVIKN